MEQLRSQLKVTALAGGVGGAKMAHGLAQVLPDSDLTVLVNTGDDFDHYGLRICPDLDTVCYTLAGIENQEKGWGLAEESWHAIQSAAALGGPGWFNLGDKDLGTHLERTRLLREGEPLSKITETFCRHLGIKVKVLPVTDQVVPTIVQTAGGDLPFQEYFVQQKCEPVISGFKFVNVLKSFPAPGVLDALGQASLILFCPSNPFVSLDTILAIPGIRDSIDAQRKKGAVVAAVSPIIGGNVVKGPAAKMFSELGFHPSALAVANHFKELLDCFILDNQDIKFINPIQEMGIRPFVTDILMRDPSDRGRLAKEVLDFSSRLVSDKRNTRISRG